MGSPDERSSGDFFAPWIWIYPDLSEIRVTVWFCARRHTDPGRVYPDFSETQVYNVINPEQRTALAFAGVSIDQLLIATFRICSGVIGCL